ncbi:hypothetical protein SDC9_95992 [bioreactor metagenome]|uniref:Uncharacterized protein n=1 Tax=bioreactor metagenome TaxID=1076179 RepID=A0A645AHY7_9ZZZZ
MKYPQLQPQPLALLAQVGDSGCLRRRPQKRHVQQRQHGLGRVAVAVHQFVQKLAGILWRADGGNTAVQIHPLLRRGDIPLRQMGVHRQIGGAFRRADGLHALFLQHRLLQKLEIHVVAHAHHVPGLLRPQQVARAPDFQIPHGDFKPGAELHVFPDGAKALFRRLL